MRTPIAAAFAIALIMAPHLAAAQDATAAQTEAQELFEQGRSASNRGDCKTALDAFRKSQALVEGRGTLVNIALCEESLGQLVAALRDFDEVLPRLAPDDDRSVVVRQHIASLRMRVPQLRVFAAPGLSTAALTIRLDDAPFDPAKLGAPQLLDPGSHTVIASTPGFSEKRFDVQAAEGKHVTVNIEFGGAPPLAMPGPFSPASSQTAFGGTRIAGVAVAGLGVVGLVVGTITGAKALSDHADVEERCPSKIGCDSPTVAEASTGKTLSIVSTVGFAGGAVFGALGAYLIITGGPKRGAAPALGVAMSPGGARATFGGAF